MKKVFLILLSALVLVTVVIVARDSGISHPASAQEQGRPDKQVVMVHCGMAVMAEPWTFHVDASASSIGAPGVPTGEDTSCAQELANLLNADFKIADVKGSEFADQVLYTLVSQPGQ